MLTIEISCEPSSGEFELPRLTRAAEAILHDAQIDRATLSIAVVDDPTIHRLNRQYLEHDLPTDVLSFLLESGPGHVEGEVIVSSETAARRAVEFCWAAADELLLYVIHGTLHLVGYGDSTDDQRAEMRTLERRYLALFGLQPKDDPAR